MYEIHDVTVTLQRMKRSESAHLGGWWRFIKKENRR